MASVKPSPGPGAALNSPPEFKLGGEISARRRGERGSRWLVWVGTLSVGALLLWAWVSPLDIVAVAPGEVVTSTLVKKVQHLEGGIINEILAREGDRVVINQPLVTLEGISSGADLGELKTYLVGLRAEILRLEAELSGQTALKLPEDITRGHPLLARQVQELFNARRQALAGNLATQRSVITQREQSIREISARNENTRSALKLQTEQVGISANLLKEEITSRMQHLSVLREESSLKSRLAEDTVALTRLQAAVQEGESQMATIQRNYQQEVSTQLAQLRRDYAEKTERTTKFSDSKARTILRSPVEGQVKTVYFATRGGVIQPGQVVLEIVPTGERLVIEVKLPIRDIGYLRLGQTAQVRLASADASRFGTILGTVDRVSPDSTPGSAAEAAHYKVRIVTEQDRFRSGPLEYQLISGVQVVAAVIIGQRSVLDYLLSPFSRHLGEALREH
ncbi:HlyD family type I secretion periplasmic adaptor subunit [Candidatus Kaiserbacteria bacterium]|nr:HlyD family type I secretion periplasmic adaptor subunit [Candidatus Kaiserbacteria bacterium]